MNHRAGVRDCAARLGEDGTVACRCDNRGETGRQPMAKNVGGFWWRKRGLGGRVCGRHGGEFRASSVRWKIKSRGGRGNLKGEISVKAASV
ncbi:hypothetical protein PoB_005700400 [Plakobranchus ocellatus]|uniref:Uncharacterized protein n=1 Tax=Plakobranchus ocellatus TaxID=259542 RepID=A0AAV4CD14_9GAST|nr:hypothetical protein PoB_005700400 [Plakobranchus ocellatus]